MKRLLKKTGVIKRLIKTSEWIPIDANEDMVQIITDAMAQAQQIQINYLNSGWRLILPYGFSVSKNGDVLVMCYKDTGEVRSYRLDRILELLIDESLLNDTGSNNEIFDVVDYGSDPNDFNIPELPNIDEIIEVSENEIGNDLPFDEGIDYLNNDFNLEQENIEEIESEEENNE